VGGKFVEDRIPDSPEFCGNASTVNKRKNNRENYRKIRYIHSIIKKKMSAFFNSP